MPAAASPVSSRLAGHALVEALIEQGVDTVFGVPGESFLAALDGFHQHRDRIRFVACRHEGGAAFMAEAHGKLTGRPGVCFVTRGPGATNASIGVHVAFQDSTPHDPAGRPGGRRPARPRGVPGDRLPPDVRPRHAGAGEVGRRDARRPIACPSTWRARSAPRCRAGPGPVVLALPEDMLSAPTAAPVLPHVVPVQAHPDPHVVEQFRQLLIKSERPFAIVGGSGWTADSACDFERFAEDWEIPVGCAFRFQDVFDNRHRLYAGDVGIGINPKLAQRIRDVGPDPRGGRAPGRNDHGWLHIARGADAAPAAGAHPRRRRGAGPRLPADHRAAVFDGRGRLRAGRGRPADAALARRRGAGACRVPGQPGSTRRSSRWISRWSSRPSRRRAPAGAIYTNGAGNYAGWLHRFHQYSSLQREGRTQLAPTAGAMGYGVPAAIGANLLFPDRTAIAIAGDGDFLMTGQELATATQYGAGRGAGKLVVVVVDNGTYGTIRMHQERDYPARVSGTALTNPDFVQLAPGLRLARGAGGGDSRSSSRRFAARCEADGPTLLHLLLPEDVSTSRTTLTALREAAQAKKALSSTARQQMCPGTLVRRCPTHDAFALGRNCGFRRRTSSLPPLWSPVSARPLCRALFFVRHEKRYPGDPFPACRDTPWIPSPSTCAATTSRWTRCSRPPAWPAAAARPRSLIQQGGVLVNGEADLRRGRKVRAGDEVTLGDRRVAVRAAP